MISENMQSQVGSEVNHCQVLNQISDHYAEMSALKRSDEFIRNRGGNIHPLKKNRGWNLEVEWIPLKDINTSNHVSEYDVANSI